MAPPTAADLAEHLGLTSPSPEVLARLSRTLATAHQWLLEHYLCDPWTDSHELAELHIAARREQARGAPLGVLDGGDYGTTFIPARQVIVRELLTDPRGGFA